MTDNEGVADPKETGFFVSGVWCIVWGMCLLPYIFYLLGIDFTSGKIVLVSAAGVWFATTFTGARLVFRLYSKVQGQTYYWLSPFGLLLYVSAWVFGLGLIVALFYQIKPHMSEGVMIDVVITVMYSAAAVSILAYVIYWLRRQFKILQPQEV